MEKQVIEVQNFDKDVVIFYKGEVVTIGEKGINLLPYIENFTMNFHFKDVKGGEFEVVRVRREDDRVAIVKYKKDPKNPRDLIGPDTITVPYTSIIILANNDATIIRSTEEKNRIIVKSKEDKDEQWVLESMPLSSRDNHSSYRFFKKNLSTYCVI